MRYELRSAQLVFMEGRNFIDVETVEVEPAIPRPPQHSCGGLGCLDCWNKGVRYADYLKQRGLENW